MTERTLDSAAVVSNSVMREPGPRGATAFFERHWLMLVSAGLGTWVLAPWLAPLFMHWGWTGAGDLIYTLYSAFCHQLPQRSWFLFGERFTYSLAEITAVWPQPATFVGLRSFVGTPDMGWKLAWSDRMVSFYGGLFLFALLYAVLRGPIRGKGWQMRWPWLLVLLAPITLDGLSHMVSDLAGIGAGFRDSNVWLAGLTNQALPAAFYQGDGWGTFNSLMRLATGVLGSCAIVFCALPRLERSIEQAGRPARPALPPVDR